MASGPSLQDVIRLVEADTEGGDPLSRVRAASALVQNLTEVGDASLGYFVEQSRLAGHSWSEIGDALGVSKQAAQQKQTVRLSLGLNAPTFDRFTPRARSVLRAAEPIAREWGHGHIGPEHLLLALYWESEGLAAQILNESNLPMERAETSLGTRVDRGPGAPEEKLTFTDTAVAVFTGALASALEMGHNYIGTEHLLLGLSRGDGPAAEVMKDAGLDHKALELKISEKLSGMQAKRPASRVASKAPTDKTQAERAYANRRRTRKP
jgi:Clp amino terminal domain, pathogenicity island component